MLKHGVRVSKKESVDLISMKFEYSVPQYSEKELCCDENEKPDDVQNGVSTKNLRKDYYKNEESNVNIASVFDNVTFNLPNVIDSQAFVRELVTNKKAERAIQAMTIDRIRGGSSLAKYKYKH